MAPTGRTETLNLLRLFFFTIIRFVAVRPTAADRITSNPGFERLLSQGKRLLVGWR